MKYFYYVGFSFWYSLLPIGFLNGTPAEEEEVPDYGEDMNPVPKSVVVPASVTKSGRGQANPYLNSGEEQVDLIWAPMTLMGTWVDDDMSRKQFVKIVLPAGLTDPSEVQIRITEDKEHLELKTALPEFLTESFSLHKHTFDIDYRMLTEAQKKKNLRFLYTIAF